MKLVIPRTTMNPRGESLTQLLLRNCISARHYHQRGQKKRPGSMLYNLQRQLLKLRQSA